MSQGWSKIFNRINWLNRPSKETSLGATNLNKSDYALDEIDNRVIQLDAIKADMITVNGMVSDVSLDATTGILMITYKDGSEKTYNTNLQKIAVNFDYDSETERLILTMPDGSMQYIDLSALITQFEFLDSDTIAFSVDSNGKVSATIKNGSITEPMLETGYLSNIKVEVAKAEAAVTQAQSSEASSDYNAKLSQSYAIGLSGIREGENTDNAKYYNEQAQEALSKMQDAQVTGVKGENETTYRKGEVNVTAENVGAVAVGGNTADNIVSFTSGDGTDPTGWTDVSVLATGEKHKSILAKISTMFKNIRYLYKMLGTTDISSIGDGTATGAISTLNSNLSGMVKLLLCSRPQQLAVSNITTTYTPITKEVTLTLQEDTPVLVYISAFVTFSSGAYQANIGIQDICDGVTKKYSLPGVGHATIDNAPFSGWTNNIVLNAGTHRISIVAGSTNASKTISVLNSHTADIVIFGIC